MQLFAITGIGCRFPGGIHSPETFWNLVSNGIDAITEIPPERLDLKALYDSRPKTRGKIITRDGGFLDGLDLFDPYFFGVSPREAKSLDPQQRLLLEVSWEALEDAGIVPGHLAGSQTGVFIGMWTSDFEENLHRIGPDIDLYMTTGSGRYSASGRLSYFLDLRGPSLTLDTACSSSLVAIHLACESIERGECTHALVGGVNVILQPAISIGYSRSGMLSPEGRCKFGDASANGYVRSEGIGIVVLKPLDQALKDNDSIYAIIRGSAVNNDGHSSSHLVTPSIPGQIQVMQDAYRNAGVQPCDVGYVEAHGTGTSVGDSIELQALGAVLAQGRSAGNPCLLGSVKTNIGHTESAAGIAGLIKAALSLKHRVIPPTLHCNIPNPQIPWAELPVQLVQQRTPWPTQDIAIAGVNSFGITGTNAHVVLQEAPPPVKTSLTHAVPSPSLFPLSAHSPQALLSMIERYEAYLSTSTEAISLYNLCYTASVHRTHHSYRYAFIATDQQELVEQLQQVKQACKANIPPYEMQADEQAECSLVFVFPGQGAQWVGMGRQLLEQEPVFRAALENCQQAMQPYIDWSLTNQLLADPAHAQFDQIDVIQPLLFAFQVALVALWRSWGVEPTAVIGHSMGEVAAAHIAGVLSLDDAARIICHRSQLLRRVSGQGAMALVELPVEKVRRLLIGYENDVAIAIINSSRSTVLSGDPIVLHMLLERVKQQNIFCRSIKVDVASHSPQMDILLPPLLDMLQGLTPQEGIVPFYSTVTGKRIDGQKLDAEYWAHNLRDTVRFSETTRLLIADNHTCFLEISPHPLLLSALQEELSDAGKQGVVVSSLHREQDEHVQLYTSLRELYMKGLPIQWLGLYPMGANRIALPLYAWQKERFWPDGYNMTMGRDQLDHVKHHQHATGHPLLQEKLSLAGEHPSYRWQAAISTHIQPFLNDHKIEGKTVLPATAYIEMVLAAATEILETTACTIKQMQFKQMLEISEEVQQVQLLFATDSQKQQITFQFFSRPELADREEWSLHGVGTLAALPDAPPPPLNLPMLQEKLLERTGKEEHYTAMRKRNLPYGPDFQGVQDIWSEPGQSLARLTLNDTQLSESDSYRAHPTLLDAALQVVLAALPASTQMETYVPVSFAQMKIYHDLPHACWVLTSIHQNNESTRKTFYADLTLFLDDGKVLLEIQSLGMRRLGLAVKQKHSTDALQRWLYDLHWSEAKALPPVRKRKQPGTWLIFADTIGVGQHLQMELEQAGDSCILVSPGNKYEHEAEKHYTIQPTQLEAFKHLFRETIANTASCSGIIYLWSLTGERNEETGLDQLPQQAQAQCESLLYIVQTMIQIGWRDAPRLWIVTNSSQVVREDDRMRSLEQTPLWGMARVIAYEHAEFRSTCLDLSTPYLEGELTALATEIQSEEQENQIALRGTKRYVARLQSWTPPQERKKDNEASLQPIPEVNTVQKAEMGRAGIIDTLHLQKYVLPDPKPGEVQIRVAAAGVNFSDIMKMMNMYPGGPDELQMLGLECSGTIVMLGEGVNGYEVGDEVVAIAPGSFSTYVNAAVPLIIPRPEQWTLEEAAGIPIAFLTAYYALVSLAKLQAGERVLIHAASGGVGLAAIQIAQQSGAEIFATAGSEEKRSFLRSLGIVHVMDSRSLAFADEIKQCTDGYGVDIILNSLGGEAIPTNLTLLAPYGRFLELGKTDIYQNREIGLWNFQRNLSFYAIDLADAFLRRPQWCGNLLRELLHYFLEKNLRPLPQRCFPIADIVEAAHYMALAKHIGKIILTVSTARKHSSIEFTAPSSYGEGTYLITGGLGGLGLLTARWLIQRGAKYLLLVGRSAPTSEAQRIITDFEQSGVQVQIDQADVADYEELAAVLQKSSLHMPPLRGVIHAAGILDDGTVLKQTSQRFQRVMAPKVSGAWNLHRLTSGMQLDFFVLFSSASAVLGFAGQSNYAAANAFLDALAYYRQQQHLPALSINWGPWLDVGLAAAQVNRGGRLASYGVAGIKSDQGIILLEYLLEQHMPQVTAMSFNVRQWYQFYPKATGMPFLQHLDQGREAEVQQAMNDENDNIRRQLQEAEPERRQQILEDYISEQIVQVLRIPRSRINRYYAIDKIGFDSLMAVEFRNRLEVGLGLTLKTTLIWTYSTLPALAEHLAEKMGLELLSSRSKQQQKAQQENVESQELFASLDQLSDEEMALLLANELTHQDEGMPK